jgi:hypothetical protein
MDGNLNIERDPESGDLLYSTPKEQTAPVAGGHLDNLAKTIDQNTLDSLSDMLTENIAIDEDGRAAWEEQQADILEIIGLKLDGKTDTDDEICDTSDHPLLLTAWLRFQAKALSALLPSDMQAVNTIPAIDLEGIEDADERSAMEEEINAVKRRVGRFYAEYLFERLPAYEEDTDLILADMGLIGCGLRKVVTDRTRVNTPVIPEYVNPADLIFSFNTRNFRDGRYTHRMNVKTGDILRRMRSGAYRTVRIHDHDSPDLGLLTETREAVYGFSSSGLHQSETHRMFEVYTDLYLKSDQHPNGLPRPYIVTIHGASREVMAIQRNWLESDQDETPLDHFTAYLYHPGRNAINGVGLGQLLGNITKALRKAQRRALESAHLQNHASGFKLSSLTIRDGETRLKQGEFVDVDSPVNDIRSAIMPHIFQGPSPGLMQLSDKMEANGQQLGGIASIDFAALMKSGVAAGPAMAAFEESTEFQTAVHRRLYKAHRKELMLIHERMRSVLGNTPVVFSRGAETLHPGDLMKVDIIPFMKPGQASRQKVILEAQALVDVSISHPDIMDVRAALKNYVTALNSTDGTQMLLPDPAEEEVMPADPVTEYNMALAGKPIKVGLMQDHASHIAAHASQMKIIETSQLPIDIGQRTIAALGAHIAEHMGSAMTVATAASMGMPADQLSAEMPPEMEAQMAPQLAQAILAFEEQTRPADGEASEKLQIEQMKQQGQAQRDQIKAAHDKEMAELKKQHAIELQRAKDEAAMSRELEDNAAAILIADMKGNKAAAANAGALIEPSAGAVGNAKA